MSESGAVHRIGGSGLLARTVARVPSRADWTRIGPSVRGPLLTLATAIAFDLLARHNPQRILDDQELLPVPPLRLHASWWDRIRAVFE